MAFSPVMSDLCNVASGNYNHIDGGVAVRFVVLGGLAEFSQEQLTILAESATAVDEFDLADLVPRSSRCRKN